MRFASLRVQLFRQPEQQQQRHHHHFGMAYRTTTTRSELPACMRRRIQDAESCLRLLKVRNPAHTPDIFTDRWPEQRSDQQLWARDLQTLIDRLKTLQRVGFDPAAIQSTFDDLFGEKAGEAALKAYHQARMVQVEHGTVGMKPGGQFKPAAPALGAGVAAASGLITPARANTNMGGVVPDDNCW